MELFPYPLKYEEKEGKSDYVFSGKMRFFLPKDFKNSEFLKLAGELWNGYTAGQSSLEIVKTDLSGVAYISESKSFETVTAKTEYDYEIDLSENGFKLIFNDDNGLIHAFTTVIQTLGAYRRATKDFCVKQYIVYDKPALEFRAYQVSVFFDRPLLFYKKLIRLCGLMKCSHIVLDFWGTLKLDTIKSAAWEGAFTKKEFQSLIDDAHAFGMKIIPIYNSFGHASQSRFKTGKHVFLDQDPTLEELFLPGGWTWDISNPETLELLKNIRVELCDYLGECEYFHIGCDEAYAFDDRRKLTKEDGVIFTNHVNKIAEHLETLGRRPIMWGDMLLNRFEFAYPYCSSSDWERSDNAEIMKNLNPDIIIDDWQYNVKVDSTGTLDALLENRRPETLIVSPWDNNDNIKGRAELAKKYGLKGMLGTSWHTIFTEIKPLTYSCCLAWEQSAEHLDLITWETYKTFTAQNIRKLLPHLSYSEAGFIEKEIFEAIQ